MSKPRKKKLQQIARVFRKLERLKVIDRHGNMYLPVYGYDGQISNYALAVDAVRIAIMNIKFYVGLL